jgi:hypothetical protein
MAMSHKAFAFDWNAFERDELYAHLPAALSSGDPTGLIRYIEAHLEYLKDPYEGNPLGDDWQDILETRDVHNCGDFALTRFYDPVKDSGIWDHWRAIDRQLSKADQAALLGMPFGPSGAYFDPGRLGSYFQTPNQVIRSLARVCQIALPGLTDYQRKALERFQKLLEECQETGHGLYVTF